ncbi:MAG: NAD(P)/FAD-dependent oxidoreductase [Thermodesulfobacteriota bacterium]
MSKHLVIVGAGHAHLTLLKRMAELTEQGHRATVISKGAFHYYSGMGPGMISGAYTPAEIRFHVRQMTESRGGLFLEDAVVRIDPEGRRLILKSGGEIGYDVVSFNTGSRVDFDIPEAYRNRFVFPVKPIHSLVQAREELKKALEKTSLTLCIAGGGPAGVEISANLCELVKQVNGEADIILLAGKRLLSGMGNRVRKKVLQSLTDRGVSVREGVGLKDIAEKEAVSTDGSRIKCDYLFPAVGVAPSPMFRESGLPVADDGGLRVNRFLQSVSFPEIYGGGDCIAFDPRPIDRVGVYAVRENPILFENISASLAGSRDFQTFKPQKSFLLILNMGNGTGIAQWKSLVWQGRSAFLLKDYIDRKFMSRFQVSGEQS